MTVAIRSLILASFLVVASLAATDYAIAAPAGYRKGQATPLQIMQSPKFCWWEYDARYAATQQLIQNCGDFTNHFCGADLGYLISQDPSRSKAERMRALDHALRETEYTLARMPPECSIRSYVTRRYGQIRSAYPGFGRPMPPSILARPPKK